VCILQQVNYSELKNECIIKQVDKDRFSLRLRIAGGIVSVDELKKVYELANKYGSGHIHLTARQSIEIPYIKLQDIEKIKEEMLECGLKQGVCGAKVRTVTACQGCKVCPSGLIDSTEIALEFDSLYYARKVPHKFKFGISGCKNNCLKAEENDFGIKGAMKPFWQKESCNYCGLCEIVCPTKAIKVDKNEKSLIYNEKDCICCGKCVKSCPTNAWVGKSGYIIYFGGMFGNNISIGEQLLPIIYSKDELHKIAEATLTFFEKYGNQKERFGNTLNRVGRDIFKKFLDEI
jgi:anaerobic sulfite reductase subunit C